MLARLEVLEMFWASCFRLVMKPEISPRNPLGEDEVVVEVVEVMVLEVVVVVVVEVEVAVVVVVVVEVVEVEEVVVVEMVLMVVKAVEAVFLVNRFAAAWEMFRRSSPSWPWKEFVAQLGLTSCLREERGERGEMKRPNILSFSSCCSLREEESVVVVVVEAVVDRTDLEVVARLLAHNFTISSAE